MNTKHIAAAAFSSLILAGGFAGMVSAQSAAEATSLTEEQIIEIALNEVPGDVTEVELEERRGHQIYEVEILTADGNETELRIAAESGDILKARGEGCEKAPRGDDA